MAIPWLAQCTSRKETEMSKAFACRDIGMDCDWRTNAETEGEILVSIGEHVAAAHQVIDTPSELLMRVRQAIREET